MQLEPCHLNKRLGQDFVEKLQLDCCFLYIFTRSSKGVQCSVLHLLHYFSYICVFAYVIDFLLCILEKALTLELIVEAAANQYVRCTHH